MLHAFLNNSSHLVLQVVIRQLNWFQCCNMDRANCCFKGGQQRCYTIWERKCEREDQVWFNKVYKPIFSSDSLQNTILALVKSKCCNATNFKYRWPDLLMYFLRLWVTCKFLYKPKGIAIGFYLVVLKAIVILVHYRHQKLVLTNT